MGSGMAGRLLAAGYPLTVYNRSPEKAQSLVERGAELAKSPRDAASGKDVIVSMLADDQVCREVWLGKRGALDGAAPGAILVESSTVTVEWIHQLKAAAQARGCELLDAPVTGSKIQASAGELRFLVGGFEATLTRILPVLKAMSRDVAYLGPHGCGARMKLINNFMCGVQAASLAEALSLIERSSIEPHRALAILNEGAPGSPIVKVLSGRMLARDYQPQFRVRLMAKDLRYAIQDAKRQSIDLTCGAAALGVLERAIAAGQGERDLAAVVEQFRPVEDA
jgi:3-hydroxyisobutyrate dehydrogenase